MNAQELRIGNWINEYGIPKQVMPNDILRLHQIEQTKKICIDLTPIFLTEEWLLKFHSEEEMEKSGRFPNEITIYDRFKFIYKEQYKYWYVITSNHKEYLTKIEFVHEYQNFILALTGEELTIK
jgi:hypothetical protein